MRKNYKDSQPKNKQEIIDKYVNNLSDDGRMGRGFEVDFREKLMGAIHRVHPLGVADVTVKRGVTVECKTGCGWLVNPEFDSADEALEYFESTTRPMCKASHVAYLPKWDGSNTEDAIILTQEKFLAIFSKYGLIRVKSGNGMWGMAIQSYIPTPKFKPSMSRFESVMMELADNGEIIEEFAERMFK